MLTKKNRCFSAKTYLRLELIKDRTFEFDRETKRTYFFKVGKISIGIPKKALREFEEMYR